MTNIENTTNNIKQDIVDIENTTNVLKQDFIVIGNKTTEVTTQVNDITRKAVLSDGNGRVDEKNGSSVIDLIVSKRGIRTLRPNDLFKPSARIATRDVTLQTSEPEFLEGVVEASGTGVPADGYVFYRYDDSNVNDGLNSRVEIEMPKNSNKGYIFGRDLTIGTDSKSDPRYNLMLQNAKCIPDTDMEETPSALMSKQYGDSNYVQVDNFEGEVGTRSLALPSLSSWSQPSMDNGMILAPSTLGVRALYTVPPGSIAAIGMENTSPINSVDFTGSIRLATNFSVVKLWLMDVTDPSDQSVFFEATLANVNGKVCIRNE